jgi:RNA polymerase sigma-70 factor (ECF subfamily)
MFGGLYAEHAPAVRRWIERLGGRGTVWSSDDLVQDVFLEAALALPRFRHESNVRTWLFAIARNVLREHLRRDARRARLLESRHEPPPDVEAEGDAIVLRDDGRRLSHALGQLPERHRRAFELLELDGLPTAAVARRLGASETTVRVWLLRARRKLRLLMTEVAGRRMPVGSAHTSLSATAQPRTSQARSSLARAQPRALAA